MLRCSVIEISWLAKGMVSTRTPGRCLVYVVKLDHDVIIALEVESLHLNECATFVWSPGMLIESNWCGMHYSCSVARVTNSTSGVMLVKFR